MRVSFDDIVRGFAQFLDASWNAAVAAATIMEEVEPTEFLADWLQANWELLVETAFRESVGFGEAYLEPYGEGADCNQASSRVWNPRALPTHRVVCRARESTAMRDLLASRPVDVTQGPIVFDHFAAWLERGWHDQVPPFDCVVGYQMDQEILLRRTQVTFVAEQLGEARR